MCVADQISGDSECRIVYVTNINNFLMLVSNCCSVDNDRIEQLRKLIKALKPVRDFSYTRYGMRLHKFHTAVTCTLLAIDSLRVSIDVFLRFLIACKLDIDFELKANSCLISNKL